MKKQTYRNIMIALGGALIMCVLLAVDLITKALAETGAITSNGNYFLGIIGLQFTTNPGIAFGIFGDNLLAMEIISYVTVVLAVLIAVMFFTLFRKNTPVRICLAVVEAGALGNIIDRFCLGHVRDFVDVRPLGFGICNLADFFITGGIVAVLICILFIGKDAVFPLTKKWREEAKREDKERDRRNGYAGQDEGHE